MRARIKQILNRIYVPGADLIAGRQREELDSIKLLLGQCLVRQLLSGEVCNNVRASEFKVFSQFGDDGIIQYLIRSVDIPSETFIEFGVENYTESNTRFLLMNNNWKGLVLDGSAANIDFIRRDSIYWRHDITAVCAFIDRDNVNGLFINNGFRGEIGILSIDIDGNDYWVWEAIDSVDPAIVIIEYNSLFGPRYAMAVPYDPGFVRMKAHFSNLYWGSSITALCRLADRKGYAFIGANSAGNNAYFVKKQRLGRLKALTGDAGYVESKFRESREKSGRLSYVSGKARIAVIEDLPVYDLETNSLVTIKDLTQGAR